MDKREVLSKAAEFSKRAESYFSFNKAVLFGSYIDGSPREDSDLDIAFFVDKISEEIDYLTLLV
ncbi:MAG: nucleotidyltransferase domain-containing protein, partial [Bacteroidota bacterium]